MGFISSLHPSRRAIAPAYRCNKTVPKETALAADCGTAMECGVLTIFAAIEANGCSILALKSGSLISSGGHLSDVTRLPMGIQTLIDDLQRLLYERRQGAVRLLGKTIDGS